MEELKIFLVLLSGLVLCNGLKLPNYIKPCSISSPNFNECVTKNANDALPAIFKGDPKYHIPALLPLRFPELKISTNQLSFKLTNVDISADKMFDIKSIEVNTNDPDKIQVKTVAFVPILVFDGTYKVDGRILVLPIVGAGHSKFTFYKMVMTHQMQFKTIEKNGKKFLRVADSKCHFTTENIKVNMENLFNDNALSDNMNKFMNENWREVLAELQEPVNEILAEVIEVVVAGIFEKVPQDKLILP